MNAFIPRKLVFCDKASSKWKTIVPRKSQLPEYVYVSYSALDFSATDAEKIVQQFCEEMSSDSHNIFYWLDNSCLDKNPNSDRAEDLYQMGSVIQHASKTLVLIKSTSGNPAWTSLNPDVCKNWRNRLLAFPEVFYSNGLYIFLGNVTREGFEGDMKANIVQCESKYFLGKAYPKNDHEHVYTTSSIYSHLQSRVIRAEDRFTLLLSLLNARLRIIKKTYSTPDRRRTILFPGYYDETKIVYAAMAFFDINSRILPIINETADAARDRFIQHNGLKGVNFQFTRIVKADEVQRRYLQSKGLTFGKKDNQLEIIKPRTLSVSNSTSGDRSQDWKLETDADKISALSYIAISYMQGDFDSESIKTKARQICRALSETAYWLDVECGDKINIEKDLFCICDIFRAAKAIVICISEKGRHGFVDANAGNPLSHSWSMWGERLWTLPEAVLAKKIYYVIGQDKPQEISPYQVIDKAYSKVKCEKKLMDEYHNNVSLSYDQVVCLLIEAVKRRTSSNLTSLSMVGKAHAKSPWSNMIGHQGYKAERIYVMMGFLCNRITPHRDEEEMNALMRLLAANGLDGKPFLEKHFPGGDFTQSIYSHMWC